MRALSIVRKYHPDVTTIKDAKRHIDIEVTKEDALGANNKSPSTCALAKALCRTFDGAIVSVSRAYLIKGKVATRYMVPDSISRELVSFDRHSDFAPGEYTLHAPGTRERLGVRRYPPAKKRYKRKNYPNSKARLHRTTGIREL